MLLELVSILALLLLAAHPELVAGLVIRIVCRQGRSTV